MAAVTGAARGIGRATARALVREGMQVAIGDLDAALAERTARELGAVARPMPRAAPVTAATRPARVRGCLARMRIVLLSEVPGPSP